MSSSTYKKIKMNFSGDSSRAMSNKVSYRRRKSTRRLRRNAMYTPLGRSFPAIMNMKFTYNKVYNLTSNTVSVNYL